MTNVDRALLATSALVLATASIPAAAQQAPASAPGEAAESTDGGSSSDDIVVTATKLGATALSRTAISASVVSSADLNFRKVAGPEDLMHATSGVYIDPGSSTPKIAIRGVSFDNFQIAAENGVTTYIDGIVVLRTQAQLAAFTDLDRVEVLKGPQGSAFGRNSTGGSINYITAKPQEGFHGSVNVGAGSFGRREYGGVLNFGTDTIGVRAAGKIDKDNGYVTNLVTGSTLNNRDNKIGRVVVQWKPSSNFNANYLFNIVDTKSSYAANVYVTPEDAALAASLIGYSQLTVKNPQAPLTLARNGSYTAVNGFDPYTNYQARVHGITMNYSFGGLSLTSITGFLDFKERNRSDYAIASNTVEGLIRTNYFNPRSHQFSQELLLNGAWSGFKWVVGGYYLHERVAEQTQFVVNVPGADPLNAPTAPDRLSADIADGQILDSFAVFADGQVNLTERLKLNAGMRITHDRKQAFGRSIDYTFVSSGGITVPGFTLDGKEVKNSPLTGQIGLDYQFAGGEFLYAKYSRGYKAGGVNNNDGKLYRPEYINAFEVGLKGKALDGTLTYALSAFLNDYRDTQQFVSPPNQPSSSVFNAGVARIIGIDADASWKATSALSLDVAASWLPEAKFTRFIPVTDAILGTLVDFTGARLSRAPRLSALVGVNLDVPLSNGVKLRARIEDYHLSDVAFTYAALLRPLSNTQQSYDVVNANLMFTIDDAIDISAYARNLTKQFYLTGIVESSGVHFGEFGRPREFGLDIKYRW